MLDHPGESFDVALLLMDVVNTPVEEIQAAIDVAISPEQAVKLRQCLFTHR
jgi:transposase